MLTLNQHIKREEAYNSRQYAIERMVSILDPKEVIYDSPLALDALVRYAIDGNKTALDQTIDRCMWEYAAKVVDRIND